MKTNFALGLIFGVLISLTASFLFDQSNYGSKATIRNRDAEIARLKLENDTLRENKAQEGWYESRWIRDNGD